MTFDPPLFLIGTIFGLTVGYGVQQWRIIRLNALRRLEQAAYKASIDDLLLRHKRLQERHDRLYDSGRTRSMHATRPAVDLRASGGYVGAGRPVIGAPPRVIAQGDSNLHMRRSDTTAEDVALGVIMGSAIGAGESRQFKAEEICKPATIEQSETSSHHSAPSYDSGSSDSGSSSSSGSDSGSSGGGGD